MNADENTMLLSSITKCTQFLMAIETCTPLAWAIYSLLLLVHVDQKMNMLCGMRGIGVSILTGLAICSYRCWPFISVDPFTLG